MRLMFITAVVVAVAAGCVSSQSRVVDRVAISATQPSGVAVGCADFETLWSAVDATARDLLFMPARQDRRAGLYRTEPMISAQWFEPWRRELRSAGARSESSLASLRRTLSVQVTRQPDGTFAATPSVMIERYALTERRITTAAGYKTVFRDRPPGPVPSAATDAGLALPDSYWYPDGNDPELERYVAAQITAQIAGRVAGRTEAQPVRPSIAAVRRPS